MDQTISLNEAISLIEAGELEQAGVLLAECVRRDPNNLEAWTWLSRCIRTERQKEWCEEQINRIKARQTTPQPIDQPNTFQSSQEPSRRISRFNHPWAQLALALVAGLFLVGSWWLIGRLSPAGATTDPAQDSSAPATVSAELLPGKVNSGPEQFLSLAGSLTSPHSAYLPGLFSAPPTPIPAPDAVEEVRLEDPRPNPKKWKSYPVIPYVSQAAINLWEKGVKEGNDPHAFSVLGDCHSAPNVLFGRFADAAYLDEPAYRPYRKTLKFFQGSWDRSFITVANGMSVASVFNPLWAQNSACKQGESPLKCELRVHNPSILIISLGTNWGGRDPDEFEDYLRQIVDFSLEAHVLPIIATKGDPAGLNNPLNERMVRVAYDYDIPLWNFWAAIQDLPDQGLKPWDRGGVYLSEAAWVVKRDTGLMALDDVRKRLSGE